MTYLIFWGLLLYFIVPSLYFIGNFGGLTWVRHSSCRSSATHSYQCVQCFCVFKQWYGCQCLAFLTWAQLLMHVSARGGCTDTVRESAVNVDSGRKLPCHTGDSNSCQYCIWLFSQMLYPLSYPCPHMPAFIVMSLTLTAGHKMAVPTVMFLGHSDVIFSQTGWEVQWKMQCVWLFLIPFLSVGPVMLLWFGSPLNSWS